MELCDCVCSYCLRMLNLTFTDLSASTSSGFLPCAQLFTIQAVSKAARKPRAQPVPIGQKGYSKTDNHKHVNWIKHNNHKHK